jgi:hypothetical protein
MGKRVVRMTSEERRAMIAGWNDDDVVPKEEVKVEEA